MIAARRLVVLAVLAVATTACGGHTHAISATDATSGVTISVAGDRVTVARSETSSAGTGGVAGQVGCTDDYAKLATATEEPAPSEPWYAATLITWPGEGDSTTATLSHALGKAPDLCIAMTSDQSAQAVVYFHTGVKVGIARLQQAGHPASSLESLAGLVLQTQKDGAFPSAAAIVSSLAGHGVDVTTAATLAGVTETGTMYVLTSETTRSKVVVALEGADGTLRTLTQPANGAEKIAVVHR